MKRNANTTATATAATATVDVIDRAWSFTADSAALFGHVFPVTRYAIAKDESVYVNAVVEGVAQRLHIGKASPVYHDALMAAVAAKAAADATKVAPATQEAKPAAKAAKQPKAEAKPAAEPAKPVARHAKAEPAKPVAETKPARHAKPAAKAAKQPKAEAKPAVEPAKPVETKAVKPAKQAKPTAEPAKPVAKAEAKPAAKPVAVPADSVWVGTAIEGKGWRIAFDEAAQRTRVIFDADPSAKQKAAIDAAGFYWSNTTKSWNKKLTRKAYRAAQALAETLNAIK